MKFNSKLPIDFSLPENIEVEGAVFVRLPSLTLLDCFWRNNQSHYSYAVRGVAMTTGQTFLDSYEWIFARSKVELVRAFTRWDKVEIQCVWYDWATDDPITHAQWFKDRDLYRDARLAEGSWDSDQEQEYKTSCETRTPESYRGWWTLENLPHGTSSGDWFAACNDPEIFDRSMSKSDVVKKMQELTYESFSWDSYDIAVMDAKGIDEEIEYWKKEKASGAEYYGIENEI